MGIIQLMCNNLNLTIMEFYVNENKNNFFANLQNYLIEKGCNLFLIEAEYQRPGMDDQSTDFIGLDLALTLNPDEAPIILCSIFREKDFISDKDLSIKFFALMAKKRVGFIDSINEPKEFYKKYLELIDGKKVEDPLAIELNQMSQYQKEIGHIEHSIGYGIRHGDLSKNDERVIEAIKKARKIGVIGTDEEVLKTILDFKRDSKDAKFVGKYFPGVFCDLEGTLLIDDGVNLELLRKLEELSLTKPITLWTAGDIEEYQKKLISKGILWKLVSKTDFFGAEVEIAYDDLSYKEFNSKFGIKVRNFNQVGGSFNEELELRLEFLHSLLLPSGVSDVLMNQKFSLILDMVIEPKTVRDYIFEMEKEKDEKQYNQKLIIVRDFLVN
jgi:hypothetical protein